MILVINAFVAPFDDLVSIQKTILHVNTIGIANDSINRNQIASDKTMKN